jgi:hypothetical protein
MERRPTTFRTINSLIRLSKTVLQMEEMQKEKQDGERRETETLEEAVNKELETIKVSLFPSIPSFISPLLSSSYALSF